MFYEILLPSSLSALASRFHPPAHSLPQSVPENGVAYQRFMIDFEIGFWQLYMGGCPGWCSATASAAGVRYRHPKTVMDMDAPCRHATLDLDISALGRDLAMVVNIRAQSRRPASASDNDNARRCSHSTWASGISARDACPVLASGIDIKKPTPVLPALGSGPWVL
jgi:hypothetical protein